MKTKLSTRAASTSLGRALRSPGESAEVSYLSVTGAKRALICLSWVRLGITAAAARRKTTVINPYCGIVATGRTGRACPAPTMLLRGITDGYAQFAQGALGDCRGGVAHQVSAAGGFGERDHVADGRFACQKHHQAVEAQGDSSVRRGAVFQGIQQEAEAAAGFVVGHAERGEDLRLHIAAVNTNRAGAEFHAVQHDVIGAGAAAGRVRGQFAQILVMHRREGMVRGVPALLFVVPFEHGEVYHPEELEVFGVEKFMAVVELLRAMQAQMAARHKDGLFGAMALRLAGPRG